MAPKAPTPAVQAKKPAHHARPPARRARPAVAGAETPSPKSAAPPIRAYFLIGETKKIAGDVAEHEWKWTRTKSGWNAGVGSEVKFLPDIHAVAKEAAKGPGPIAVFEGYKWYAVIAPHTLDALVQIGTVVIIPAPEPV